MELGRWSPLKTAEGFEGISYYRVRTKESDETEKVLLGFFIDNKEKGVEALF